MVPNYDKEESLSAVRVESGCLLFMPLRGIACCVCVCMLHCTLNPKPYKPYKPCTPYKPCKPYKPYKPYNPYEPDKPYKPYKP